MSLSAKGHGAASLILPGGYAEVPVFDGDDAAKIGESLLRAVDKRSAANLPGDLPLHRMRVLVLALATLLDVTPHAICEMTAKEVAQRLRERVTA